MSSRNIKGLNQPSLSQKSAFFLLFYLIFCLAFPSASDKRREYVRVFFPDGCSVVAELAVTEGERQQGLMFRDKINTDQGMLFVFQKNDIFSFWMKNMNFSLDILWLNQEKKIVHIESGVPPCKDPECPSYFSPIPAQYVLELKAGSVAAHQLKIYDQLEFILPPGIGIS